MEQKRRIPPHNLEAEQSVLGSMLLDQNAVISAMETLSEEDFYAPAHQVIYAAMAHLYHTGAAVDLVTVADVLERQNNVNRAGGMEYLAQLSRMVPTTTNVGQYIAIVEDRAALRQVIHAGSEMVEQGYQAAKPSGDVVSEAHDAIYSIITRQRTDSLRPISEALTDAYERITTAANKKGGLVGTSTGYPDLDAMTSGFCPDQLLILAARPGVGKTSFALNIATNIAVRQQLPVLIFSLEMAPGELAMRMMCAESEISFSATRNGTLMESEYARLWEAMTQLAQAPIMIDSLGGITVPQIRARCMRASAQKQLGLVIIDYLQLMAGSESARGQSRMQEISEMTRALKVLSRDIKAPILVLSQLNRSIETRSGSTRGMPLLSDLRESGSIEQDADMVMFLAKAADMAQDEDEMEPTPEDLVKLILAKNRNGPTGQVDLKFAAEYTKFFSVSRRVE